jgi:hypothetical protein
LDQITVNLKREGFGIVLTTEEGSWLLTIPTMEEAKRVVEKKL